VIPLVHILHCTRGITFLVGILYSLYDPLVGYFRSTMDIKVQTRGLQRHCTLTYCTEVCESFVGLFMANREKHSSTERARNRTKT